MRRFLAFVSLFVIPSSCFSQAPPTAPGSAIPAPPAAPLTLSQVLDLAHRSNPTLLSAAQHLAAVRAQEVTAGLRQNPNATAAGQMVTLGPDDPNGPDFYSVGVQRLFERGNKRQLRLIDFKRNKDGVPARVASLEYDPNRSANIALLHYRDGDKRYILAPVGLKVGDPVESGPQADIKPANALPLRSIPVGTFVHAVELKPGKGAQLSRGAGTQCQLMAKEGKFALLKLPSGEQRMVQAECRATIGQVGNLDSGNISIGKAGRNRHLGWRSYVRGMAMNPVDHPHGGGEGRSKGNHPQSPWGTPTKGYKTRGKKPSDQYIVSRRPRGKRG